VLSGCSGDKGGSKGPVGKGPIPPAFYDLSAQFRPLAGKDRLELGRKLNEILPTCTSTANAEGMLAMDYSSPSYVLTKQAAVQHLGEPGQVVENGDFIYHLGSDFRRNWYLSVEFNEDYVIVSRIYSVRKKSRKSTTKK
jgi:hypothetical protein